MTREGRVPTTYKVVQTIERLVISGPLDVYENGSQQAPLMAMIGPKGVHFRDLVDGKGMKKFSSSNEENAGEEDETELVSTFALSSQEGGRVFIAKNKKNFIESWSVETEEMVRSWKGHGSPVLCMAHHSTLSLLATGFADHSIRVWDSREGFCTHNFKGVHGSPISGLLFHPSKAELVSAAEDGSIALWDLHQGKAVKVFKRHVSGVRGLAIINDCLVSGGRDQMINIWSLRTGKLERSIPCGEAIETITLTGSEGVFAAAGEKGFVRLWSLASGACLKESAAIAAKGHSIVSMKAAKHSDTDCIVALTSDLQIAVIDAASLQPLAFFPGALGEVTDLSFLQDKSLVIASNDPDLRVMRPAHTDSPSLACQLLRGHSEAVLCVATCNDWLVSGSRDNTVRLWKKQGDAFEAIAELSGHTDAVSAVCFSSPSSSSSSPCFASAGADSTVKLWEISGEEGHYRVNSKWTIKAHEKDINSITISPNGKLLVTGSQDKTAKIWRVADGSQVATLKGHKRGIWSVCCSPFEQVIATASGDHTIKLWSAISFDCLKTFEGHSNSVLRVLFGGNANELLSTGSDGLVKIWDIRANECVQTFDEHLDRIWTITAHSNGQSLATGDATGVIKVWENVTNEAIEESQKAQEALLMMEQNLANLLLRSDFKNAIVLAIELEQPFRLFSLFNNLIKSDSHLEAQQKLTQALSALPLEKLDKICLYIRDWNTSFKRALLSQLILNTILKLHPMDTLQANMPHLKETARAILPYTQRHFTHTQDLMTNAYLVDFVLGQMNGHLA